GPGGSTGCHPGLDPGSTLARHYGLRVKPAMTALNLKPAMTAYAEFRPGATGAFAGTLTGAPGVNFQPAGGLVSSFARICGGAQVGAYAIVTSAPAAPASAKQSAPSLVLSGRTTASCAMSGTLPSGNCNWKRPGSASSCTSRTGRMPRNSRSISELPA